jgi:hypothetical protein
MGLGLALASGSLVVAVMVAVYLSGTITAAMKNEEAFLRKRFGDEYDRYRQGRTTDATNRRFSVSRAIANHEHRAVVGLLLAMLLLALKAAANV